MWTFDPANDPAGASGLAPGTVRRLISTANGSFNVRSAACPVPRTMTASLCGGERPLATPALELSVVLVGMMGAGKTSIGVRLARALHIPFRDADREIEKAAGTTISNIFAEIGEPAFRQRERLVIRRLLAGGPQVLALGGGAFMHPETREVVRQRAISIWLRARLEELVRRTARRSDRPLLVGVDPHARLQALLEERQSIYAQADLVIDSDVGSMRSIVDRIVGLLGERGAVRPG
jgi:shikimate kinase